MKGNGSWVFAGATVHLGLGYWVQVGREEYLEVCFSIWLVGCPKSSAGVLDTRFLVREEELGMLCYIIALHVRSGGRSDGLVDWRGACGRRGGVYMVRLGWSVDGDCAAGFWMKMK